MKASNLRMPPFRHYSGTTKRNFIMPLASDPDQEQQTTLPQQSPSMSGYEADRQEHLQREQDEWAESDGAKTMWGWADKVLNQPPQK